MTKATPRWEHFAHGADVGIRGIGRTPGEAFTQAALAMIAAITELDRIEAREEVAIECAGANLEDLFFCWLDAIVFEVSTRRMLFSRFEIEVENGRLSARLWGEAVHPVRHEPAVEVKGPTFTSLKVSEDATSGEWTAQCVVDV
jgi:SHS2 domain-containing protein